MFTRKTNYISGKDSVAELTKMNFGGFEQWLLIRGESGMNPILLFLHGGPGTPNIGIAADTQKQLEKNFIVVNWDQLGAGLSYNHDIPKEAMTIEKMIGYTKEVIQYLLKRFKKEKLFLVGHSWGSLLGILTAKRYPDYIEKYVGISQVVGGPETEKQCYEYCYKTAIERGNKKAIRKLKQIKEPPYDDWKKGLQVRSALSNKFGASVKNGGLPSLYFKRMLLSHEYTIFDIYKFLKGFSFSLDCLWPEIMKMNLLKEVDNLTMPIYFFLGKHDYSAPSLLAEEFLSNLKTSQKQIVWFAESAHMCNLEEQEKFTANLEHVLSL